MQRSSVLTGREWPREWTRWGTNTWGVYLWCWRWHSRWKASLLFTTSTEATWKSWESQECYFFRGQGTIYKAYASKGLSGLNLWSICSSLCLHLESKELQIDGLLCHGDHGVISDFRKANKLFISIIGLLFISAFTSHKWAWIWGRHPQKIFSRHWPEHIQVILWS